MDILNVPFGYVIKFCYAIIPNYAIALLLFAIIVKIILFPLGIKQQKNSIKQAKLRPKEMAIRKKYAGRTDQPTQQKMQEEVMALYQKENYNPMGGCLPLLIQFPIIISLYNVIRNPLTYVCTLGSETVEAVKAALVDLGLMTFEKDVYTIVESGVRVSCELDYMQLIRDNFDSISHVMGDFTVDMLPNFHMFGDFLDLALTPSFSRIDWLLAIPVLTFVLSFLSMRITRKFTYQPPSNESASGNASMSMKIMDYTMPLFSVYITFIVPAVVGVYWLYQNVLSALQQILLAKLFPVPVFTEEDYKRAEKEMGTRTAKEKKKEKVKSLHHIDDDDEDPAVLAERNEQAENAPDKGIIGRAPIKEDRDGKKAEEKNENSDKPKPRSLHHIDDDD